MNLKHHDYINDVFAAWLDNEVTEGVIIKSKWSQ